MDSKATVTINLSVSEAIQLKNGFEFLFSSVFENVPEDTQKITVTEDVKKVMDINNWLTRQISQSIIENNQSHKSRNEKIRELENYIEQKEQQIKKLD